MRRLVMTFLASVCLSICGYAEENAPGVPTPASTVDDAISEKLLALELRIVALEARPVVNLKPVFLQPAFPVPPTGEQTPGDPVPSALSEQNIPSPVTVDAMPGDVKVGYEETLLVGDPILLDVVDRPVAVFSKAIGQANVPQSGAGAFIEAHVVKTDGDVFWARSHTVVDRSDAKSPLLLTITAEGNKNDLLVPAQRPQRKDKPRFFDVHDRQSQLPRLRIDSFDKTVIQEWTLSRTLSD